MFLTTPPVPPGPDVQRPYFQEDPLLDPPWLPRPGWFVEAEVDPSTAHVKNHLTNTVQVGASTPTVQTAGTPLDWTVSPRFDLGYRLPSGFGEFVFGYRFLATTGTGIGAGPDGPATIKSRLDMQVADLDYASREFSLWPYCDMKWRTGLRLASVFFDSRVDETPGEAAGGSGILESRTSNTYTGVGPHAGVELGHRLGFSGLSLVGGGDAATLLGRIRQGFFEDTTTLGDGQTRVSGSQAVPIVNACLGFEWQPPAWHDAHFFAGYQYEYWWNVGRLSSTSNSRGELSDQGIVLRAEFNF